ncbi:DUF5675 family protein [Shewanella sp. 125m-1]
MITHGTFGELKDAGGNTIAVTAECPWLNNQQGKSCIPAGTYQISRHQRPSKGVCLAIIGPTLGVFPRRGVAWLKLNFYLNHSKPKLVTRLLPNLSTNRSTAFLPNHPNRSAKLRGALQFLAIFDYYLGLRFCLKNTQALRWRKLVTTC